MATSELHHIEAAAGRPFGLATAGQRRSVLLLAVLLAAGMAALFGQPRPALLADPDLAFLLRGMGLIKAAIALGVLALVWWRATSAVSAARFLAYVTACTLLAAAAVLVLKLAVVVATSVVFHATLLALGLLALGDDGLSRGALGRR